MGKHAIPLPEHPPEINNRNIGRVLQIIEKNLDKDSLPVVTLVGQMKRDPYRVLIATLISLRTKDTVTSVVSKQLFEHADTPQEMIKLSEETIGKLIFPAGFYKTKAKNIKKVSEIILEKYNGRVPDDIDVLTELPGVGRKTANLVLIEGYQKLAMCVDTHVHRISNIWKYVQTKTPDKTELALRKKLPKKYWVQYNELLVSWGQQHCQSVSPKCSMCPILQHCPRNGLKYSR